MGKHEAPPFRMTIEGGKLVPATPYDAERLDTYRRGTKVAVRFTEEKDRILVRKWWAVLGLIVKQCQTPWKTKDEASEAIKLALGIVNLTKTVGGDYLTYPNSLTELDDPELQEAVDQMMALVERITGVDPDTLRKEIAHVGEDDTSHSAAPSPADGSETDTVACSPSAADTSVAQESGEAETGDIGAADDQPASPVSGLSDEDRAWLKQCSKMLWAATGPGERQVLKAQFDTMRIDFTPSSIGRLARDKGNAIYERCKAICEGTADAGDTLIEIALIAGLEPKEVVS